MYSKLLEIHKNDSKPVQAHTHKRILPLVAIYTCLREIETQENALPMVEELYSQEAYAAAKMIRIILKIPGLYKKTPSFFTAMTKRSFGKDAGFHSEYLQSNREGMAFDMKKCVYFETCKRHGCPELTIVFCRMDDIAYGNMHPKLDWARTKTIGEGAEICDFRIWVKK